MLIQAVLAFPVASIWMLVQFLSVTLDIISGSGISRAADAPWAYVDVEPPAVLDMTKFACTCQYTWIQNLCLGKQAEAVCHDKYLFRKG